MFANREEAGFRLADALHPWIDEVSVVFALPRGGLPVAAIVAARFDVPLGLILVRKIGAPFQPELAIGAVVDGREPVTILHDDAIEAVGATRAYIERVEEKALVEIDRRRWLYLHGRSPISASGRTAIVVDDGIATGATVEAAIKALRRQQPKRVVLAVPVAPQDTLANLRKLADEVVCLEVPEPFWSVGSHFADFPQLTDDDVRRILVEHEKRIDRKRGSEPAAALASPMIHGSAKAPPSERAGKG